MDNRTPTGAAAFTGYAPSVVIEGMDGATGENRTKVSDPLMTSESRTSDDGSSLRLSMAGSGNVAGLPSEPRVRRTFSKHLRRLGINARIETGDDHRGEDGILRFDRQVRLIQITTVPSDPEVWKAAATSKLVNHSIDALGALQKAVDAKSHQDEITNTVLLLDARHVNSLVTEHVSSAYVDQRGDPTINPGFSSVWVVGATNCIRLGGGTP